jgi:hypothetical protein
VGTPNPTKGNEIKMIDSIYSKNILFVASTLYFCTKLVIMWTEEQKSGQENLSSGKQ